MIKLSKPNRTSWNNNTLHSKISLFDRIAVLQKLSPLLMCSTNNKIISQSNMKYIRMLHTKCKPFEFQIKYEFSMDINSICISFISIRSVIVFISNLIRYLVLF